MTTTTLGEAQYISVETFKKNGEGVKAPVWVTQENNKLYVMTGDNTWKVKRLRHNNRVRIATCDARGNIEGEWFEGTARILEEPEAMTQQRKRGGAKYGLLFYLFIFIARLRRNFTYIVIEISLN